MAKCPKCGLNHQEEIEQDWKAREERGGNGEGDET